MQPCKTLAGVRKAYTLLSFLGSATVCKATVETILDTGFAWAVNFMSASFLKGV